MKLTLDGFLIGYPRPAYWLLMVSPDGVCHLDGGHGDIDGVAKAKVLHESIMCIKPPPGTRFFSIKVEEVPEYTGDSINRESVELLNENCPAHGGWRSE